MIVDWSGENARDRYLAIVLITLGLTLIVGCGGQSVSIETIREATNSVSRGTGFRVGDRSTDDREAIAAKFEPPYPHRENPFEFPGTIESAAVKANRTTVAQVKILGFAKVDIPRVILRIGDETKIMKVGDRRSGVEVLSIQPPKAELKMDNLIWSATMFDDDLNR